MSNPYGAPPSFPNQPTPGPHDLPQQLPGVPHRLATAATWLAIALTAIVVVTAVISYPVSVHINGMFTGAEDPSAWPWFIVSTALALALFAVLIPLYIVGCLWLQQSYDFAKYVNPRFRMRRSQAWVWLGWWVPIVAFWFPFQIVDDVRRTTAKNQSRPGLAVWWAAWLIAILAMNISGRVFNSEDVLSQDAIIVVATLDALSAAAMLVACAKWVSIIRGITRDQYAARG